MGSHGQGMEFGQLPSEEEPRRPHWLLEHRHSLPWRFPLCLWWQGTSNWYLNMFRPDIYNHCSPNAGLQSHVVGLERRQEALHPRPHRHRQCPVLLAQPLLAVRCHWPVHQDLGSRGQDHGRRAQERSHQGQQQSRSSTVFVDGLVRWRTDPLRRIFGQRDPSLASDCSLDREPACLLSDVWK